MRSYILVLGTILCISSTMAADGEETGKKVEIPDLRVAAFTQPSLPTAAISDLPLSSPPNASAGASAEKPQPINLDEAIANLKKDPQNVRYTGALWGLGWLMGQPEITPQALEVALRSVSGSYNELVKRLETLEAVTQHSSAVQLALDEAQKERARLLKANEALQTAFTAESALARSLKDKEVRLLSEIKRSGQEAALEQARLRVLAEQNDALKKLVAEFEANEAEIARLLADNADREQSMPVPDPSNPAHFEAIRKSISAVIEKNKLRILELQNQNAALERSKREAEVRIAELEQAREANDFYTQIKKRILDRNIPDDDLAFYMMAIVTVQGVNLDQLSAGKGERLIETLINVSLPSLPRPSGRVRFEYSDRYRKLGNAFVPGGLAWDGVDLDLETCVYEGSQFAKETAAIKRDAKKKLAHH